MTARRAAATLPGMAHVQSKVKSRREAAGLTQAEAAERAGWSQSRWADFERGRFASPGLETYRRAAEALGCKLADILPD